MGAYQYAQRGFLSRRTAAIVCAGVMPAAGVGAFVLPFVPSVVTQSLIAVAAIYSGGTNLKKTCAETGWRPRARTQIEPGTPTANPARATSAALGGEGAVDTGSVLSASTVSVNVDMNTLIPEPAAEADPKLPELPREKGGEERHAAIDEEAEPGSAPQSQVSGQPERTVSRRLYVFTRNDAPWLVFIGVISGFMSVMTATGGPFILLPMFFFIYPEFPVKQAIAIAQCSTIPISITSTLVSALENDVDLGLAGVTSFGLVCGVPLGSALAARVSSDGLKLFISCLLVGIGGMMVFKVVRTLLEEPETMFYQSMWPM